MPSYKLHYFPARGAAEVVRLIFAQGEVKYEDNRLTVEDFRANLKSATPFGQLPVLVKEEDGEMISQSITIARYAGQLTNMLGVNDKDNRTADSLVHAMHDLQDKIFKFLFAAEEKKEEEKKKLDEKDVPQLFDSLEKLVVGPFFLGDCVSWADMYFHEVADKLKGIYGDDYLGKYPKLKENYNTVAELPRIKKWKAERPVTDL